MPDLTPAICVYNAEKELKDLQSVTEQTIKVPHQHIVEDCNTGGNVTTIY